MDQRFGQVLARGHMRKEVELLEHHSHRPAGTTRLPLPGWNDDACALDVPQVLAVDQDRTSARPFQADRETQDGGLAGAARADDRDLLGWLHRKIQQVDRQPDHHMQW